MIVVVSGTREGVNPLPVEHFDYRRLNPIYTRWRALIMRDIEQIAEKFEVSEWRVGDCPTGVDANVATRLKLQPLHIYTAKWHRHGKDAGPIRNKEMLSRPRPAGLLLAFPAKSSRGTLNTVRQAMELNIDVIVRWLL